MKRREIIKQLGAVHLAGSLFAHETALGNPFNKPIHQAMSGELAIYKSIGVDVVSTDLHPSA